VRETLTVYRRSVIISTVYRMLFTATYAGNVAK